MKVVIEQKGNLGAAPFVSGPHPVSSSGFVYTGELAQAQVFESLEEAVAAVLRRNAWVGESRAVFSFVPVEQGGVRRIV